jgi:hypothetical protein
MSALDAGVPAAGRGPDPDGTGSCASADEERSDRTRAKRATRPERSIFFKTETT